LPKLWQTGAKPHPKELMLPRNQPLSLLLQLLQHPIPKNLPNTTPNQDLPSPNATHTPSSPPDGDQDQQEVEAKVEGAYKDISLP